MATIYKEFEVAAPAEQVWAAVRDFGAVHRRLAAGFVTDSVLEEEGAVRLVTFANGMQVRERLVSLDDSQRRIVYSAQGGRTSHHNASAQVIPTGPASCRFVWTTDLLPDALAPAIGQMMELGARAMQATLQPPAR
jgi:carbon monoxide dehydrogenase subunit G